MKLELRDLHKRYADARDGGPAVLAKIDLRIEKHESVALLGRSGCGKSTLVRIVAGLEKATSGAVELDGRVANGPTSEVSLVFQEPRLMPWLTVRENIRLALVGLSRAEQDQRMDAALAAVGLEAASHAWPRQLSGGMAQRTAVARALVRHPSVLLLDEPFSALDSFTRARLQEHVLELWRNAKFTLVLVTHDIEEAIFVADRIVILKGRPGRIAEDIAIDLPRPRERTSEPFQTLRKRISESIQSG